MLDLVRSVGDALSEATVVLQSAGLADARREAHDLYALVVCGPRSAATLDRSRPLAGALGARLAAAAERRAAGWPQQYAAGRACFRGHWLAVDKRVLIPRPETEGLVEIALEWIGARDLAPVVADVGTGSGAIAISLALESAAAGLVATDISAAALNLAIENAASLGARERISFRRGNLLEPLLDDMVDLIVSNPPYVTSSEVAALEPVVRDHEPLLALDGGGDGFGPTRDLAVQARSRLTPGGMIALEQDSRRTQDAAAILTRAGFERVEVRNDLYGRPRYVLGSQPELQ